MATSGQLPTRDVSIVVRQVSDPNTYGTLVGVDGSFVVQHEAPSGIVEIAAIANGYGVGVKRYRLERGEQLSGLLFQLEPAGEIRGIIRNIQLGVPFRLITERPGENRQEAVLTPAINMLVPGERLENTVAMVLEDPGQESQ